MNHLICLSIEEKASEMSTKRIALPSREMHQSEQKKMLREIERNPEFKMRKK